jgi:erythromycin esterase
VRSAAPAFAALLYGAAGFSATPPEPPDTAQRVEWLKRHAIALRSLDAADTDFSDLIPVGEKIGAAGIVTLGEASHGDGESFRGKVRLIKYLHRHKGFGVLAWESNILESVLADRALRTGMPAHEAAGRGIYTIWSAANEVQPLFDYIRSTHAEVEPIEMIGFDSQSAGLLLPPLFAFLDRAYPGAMSAADRESIEQLHQMCFEGTWAQRPDAERALHVAVLDRLIEIASRPTSAAAERERVLMHRTLQNLRAFQQFYSVPMELLGKGGEAGNRRDISMGRNLAWLANEYYPDRKITAWAANSHLARAIDSLRGVGAPSVFAKYRPMGEEARALLGERIYSIGFIAYRGESRRVGRDTAIRIRAPAGSLEHLCHLTGQEYLFIDLKGTPEDHWLRQDLVAGAFGFTPMVGDWSEVFDAFFFIDQMHPATAVREEAGQ